MDRRRFVELSGLAVGVTALAPDAEGATPPSLERPTRTSPREAAGPHPGSQAPDVVVIGAGAFGGWTALYLQESGTQCTLVDAYGPGNPRSTSGGGLRGIRAAYGDRELYTRWVVRALELWKEWEEDWEEDLLIPTGRLTLAPELSDSIRRSMTVLDRVGVEQELITGDEILHRYPQISPEGVGVAHWEPTAHAVRAAKACRAVARAFGREGGELRIARVRPGGSSGGRLDWLTLEDGSLLGASTYVFACGPWLPRLFPELLGDRIATPRRDVFHFGTPAGSRLFDHPQLPNFSEPSAGFYGFPSIDYGGVKLAPTGGQVRFDPDTDERIVVGYQVRRAQTYLARRFPALAGQPVVESRVCQLEDTPNAHFVIDRHPEWENVWIAGGGSGHAFKHGPALGEYISRRVLGEETDEEADRLFAL